MPKPFPALIGVLCIFAAISCSSSKGIVENNHIYVDDVQYVDDKVLVIFLDMEATIANIRGAKLVEGYFRPLGTDLRQEEIVRIQYLDHQGHILFEKILDNPLIQYKEYDEDGKIKRVRIEEKRSSLLLRSQHSEAIKMIRIEYGSIKSFKTIATLPLQISS